MREIEELSSRFDREEQLEGLLILTFIEAEQEGIELDETLASEVQKRFNSFMDRAKIRASLPGSMIVNETLEDVSSAETGPGRRSTTRTEIGYDSEAGKGFITDIPADEVERQRLRAEGVLRIAKHLSVEPAGGEGIEDDLIEAMNEGPDPWKPFVGSILLAQRTRRPISPTTDGSETLLISMVSGHSALSPCSMRWPKKAFWMPTKRQYARLRLAASGSWGVTLTANEMMVEARAVEWDISRALSGALFDRAAWRGSPAGRMQELLRFLQAAYDGAPLTLGKWLRRIIEAGMQAAPHLEASWWSRNLLILAWGLDGPRERDPGRHGSIRGFKVSGTQRT